MLVCDAQGQVLHVNAALQRLLQADPEGARVRAEALALARALGATALTASRRRGEPHGECSLREVRASAGRYRLYGSYAGSDLLGAQAGVLVTVDRLTPQLPSERSLHERFGLSAKEAQVAVLLAGGQSNKAIAATLSISSHTARHHTERVLQKLGATSRAAAAALLLTGAPGR